MKKHILVVGAFILGASAFSAGFETKGNFFLGLNPVSSKYDTKTKETVTDFDSAYAEADMAVSNDYLTAGGKFYYRLSLSDDAKDVDTDKTLSQKLELKRAYLRVRPFGSEIMEISGGKLYSYYLPGNYFSLSEIYTGASRWGKTGVGLKCQTAAFTFGAAIPVTESYTEFGNTFGVAAAFGYDFSQLIKDFPLKLNGAYHYDYAYSEAKDKDDSTIIISDQQIDHRFTVSANYAPKLNGFISKLNTTVSYTYNGDSYVAHSTFKNVSNYAEIGEAWFFSLNHKNNFGPVEFILESEAGKTLDEDYIPLYFGTQLLIPFTKNFAFKPRFFYYNGLNTEDSDLTRQTYEWYPRLWVTAGQFTVSAGCDFYYEQYEKDTWKWEWSIPMYVEYKLKIK